VSTGEMEFVEGAQDEQKNIIAGLNRLEKIWPEYQSKINILKQDFLTYYTAAEKVSVSMLDGSFDSSSLSNQIERMNSSLDNTKKQMTQLSEASLEAFNTTVESSNAAAQGAQSLTLVIALTTLAIMITSAW